MQVNRREFLGRSLAGAAGVLVGRSLLFAGEAESPRPDAPAASRDALAMVPLGKTKLQLCRVGMGTGMRGGNRQSNHTRMGWQRFEALIKHGWERGLRLFDVADIYGTHDFLARALEKMPRDKYSISSKIWWRGGGIPEKERPDADVVVARFLKELRTDYLDLVLLHCVTSATWPQELRKQMDILDKLKQKGTIRAHGVSCHSIEALKAAAEEPWVDSVHARINPWGDAMDGPAASVAPLLEKLHDAGKGVVAMKVVGEGRYGSNEEKRQESIRYVLGLGAVDCMVVGFEKPEEVDDFVPRVEKVLKDSAKVPAGAAR